MPKIPKSHWLPPPPGYAERLARWRDCWLLEQHLRGSDPDYASPLPSVQSFKRSGDPPWNRLGDSQQGDAFPEVGQIRLLDGWLVPTARRPVFVAVLYRWDGDVLVIAPFGPFPEPATTTELLSARPNDVLRVISLWNVRTITPGLLSQASCHIGELTNEELTESRAVFRHAIAGEGMPAELWDRVGCPIIHPEDPRIAYQDEESRMMAFTDHQSEANVLTVDFAELPLAAGSVGQVELDLVALVPSANVRVWFHTSSTGDLVFVEAYDSSANAAAGRSLGLDGAALANAETGIVLARFRQGIAEFNRPAITCHFVLVDAADEIIPWSWVRSKP